MYCAMVLEPDTHTDINSSSLSCSKFLANTSTNHIFVAIVSPNTFSHDPSFSRALAHTHDFP
jgi:hypothetical protein